MPRDTAGTEIYWSGLDGSTLGGGLGAELDYGLDIGAALKAARERQGRSLQDISDLIKVRTVYLQALEDMQLDALPARPFAVGYVRAYAEALDLDPEAAVIRFRDAAPVVDDSLRAPIGVAREPDPRMMQGAGVALAVVAVIVLWNVAQRAIHRKDNEARNAPIVLPVPVSTKGPVSVAVGAPLPAPPEATAPPVYETPGLADAAAGDGTADAVERAIKARAATTGGVTAAIYDSPMVGKLFEPQGTVYGMPPGRGTIIMRARRAAMLIIYGPNGQVYFARQLAEGEAYRTRLLRGLVADVYDPSTIELYVDDRFKTFLPPGQTPLSGFVAPKPAPSQASAVPATAAAPVATPASVPVTAQVASGSAPTTN